MSALDTAVELATAKLRNVLEYVERIDVFNLRMCLRAESVLPAEIVFEDGKTIRATTRDISVAGIGFAHREPVSLGECTVAIFSNTREFHYRMDIAWCRSFENGNYISGGRFLKNDENADDSIC